MVLSSVKMDRMCLCIFQQSKTEGYKTLEEGSRKVEFDVVETSKGPQASKVVRI
ncbi:MAG: hypothetical protein KCCBMMGE_01639 [Candidatus Methanoperedenaceae archaeon GB37]|nr:MAG: hypothetical protein KCCBMMGE_01639 [Candidatus Methanoperedenaceae archaeon GB37]